MASENLSVGIVTGIQQRMRRGEFGRCMFILQYKLVAIMRVAIKVQNPIGILHNFYFFYLEGFTKNMYFL